MSGLADIAGHNLIRLDSQTDVAEIGSGKAVSWLVIGF